MDAAVRETSPSVRLGSPDLPSDKGWLVWAARVVLLAVLVVHVPALLCMGLDSDVSMWDLCARNVHEGGVAYRDAAENNLPGMLWLHLLVRSLGGWSSEVIRLADLCVIAATVWLLLRWLPAGVLRPATAVVLFGFYLSTSEWCHCQRDTWMLLPALVALDLRRRQVIRLRENDCPRCALAGWAFLEGVCWAAAFWIKPFVAIPALLCWLVSVFLTRGGSKGRGTRIVIDGAGLLVGGVTVGAAGIAWLWRSGAWPDFVDIVFGWNREYAAHSYAGDRLAYLLGVLIRFRPWCLVHLLALPIALEQLWLVFRRRSANLALPAALYLGWVVQAFWLQQVFDYIHAPAILLGLALVAARWPTLNAPLARWSVAGCAIVCLMMQSPQLVAQRVNLWARCVLEGSTAELRDRLALIDRTNWQELEQVAEFLRAQGVEDGEVTCYNARLLPLYTALDRKPSTRYYPLESALIILPKQRPAIRAALAASRQKYVVCDLYWMKRTEAELTRPEGKARAVLNTGRYVVLRLDAADALAWLAVSFGF
jgi:hypothetical protein